MWGTIGNGLDDKCGVLAHQYAFELAQVRKSQCKCTKNFQGELAIN
jgi:hypothetical protein